MLLYVCHWQDQALSIDSALGVSINAHNHTGHNTASLNLSPDGKANLVCDRFEVLDQDRRQLFFVDANEIGLKLENLRILGKIMKEFKAKTN